MMLCTDGVPSLLTALRDPSATLNPGAFSQIPRDRLVQGMSGAGAGPHEQFMVCHFVPGLPHVML